jgi:hypothetical protein
MRLSRSVRALRTDAPGAAGRDSWSTEKEDPMTTERQAQEPRHRIPPHLTILGFLAGAGMAAAVYFGIKDSHAFGFLTFCVIWYAVTVGIRETLTQPHRTEWAVYIGIVPVAAGAVAASFYLALGHPIFAALVGLAVAPAVQWVVAHIFLRDVVSDKHHAMLRAAGVE